MKLIVNDRACQYLTARLDLHPGDAVDFYPVKRAIDYRQQQPVQPVAVAEKGGIKFYVEFADEWFFSGKVLVVDFQAGKLSYHQHPEMGNTVKQPSTPTVPTPDASTGASRKYEEFWE